MRFIKVKDIHELSEVFAHEMLKHIYTNKERVNIAITTGTTPIEGYKILGPQIKGKRFLDNVHYYIFDEFWYKDDKVGICREALDRKFFQYTDVKEENIHNLMPGSETGYDEKLARDGGLDMICMGIGTNGHFCGNQPGTFSTWDEGTHAIDGHCTPVVEQLLVDLLHNNLHSDDESRIPDHYISMGPKTVMSAKHLVIILSGENKAEIAEKMFFGPIDVDCPASIFQLHQDVTVIIDEAAASRIKDRI